MEVIASIERQKSILAIAITNDNIQLTTALLGNVDQIRHGLDKIRIDTDDEKQTRALTRLSTIDFRANHQDVSSRRAIETGQWLLKSTESEELLASDSNAVLWLYGIPGVGKTIMSGLIIDHLCSLFKDDGSTSVAWVYLNHRDPQSIVSILGSLLKQLAVTSDTLPVPLMEDRPPTLQSILAGLKAVMPSYNRILVVIDALDECSGRLDLMKELQKLLAMSSS